jgi:hypothetical protein
VYRLYALWSAPKAEGSTVFFMSSRGSHTVVPYYVGIGPAPALAESLIRYLAVELAPKESGPTPVDVALINPPIPRNQPERKPTCAPVFTRE